MGLIK